MQKPHDTRQFRAVRCRRKHNIILQVTLGVLGRKGVMSVFLFVHGAWGQPEDWDSLVPKLGKDSCLIADLPSCQSATAGLAEDVDHVRRLMGAANDELVMVGHSYGGMVVTEAADERVRRLVYLAAFVPEVGQSTLDLLMSAPATDEEPFFSMNDDGTTTINDWASDDYLALGYSTGALEFMRARPRRPFSMAASVAPCSSAGWEQIASTYVIASKDTAVSPVLQRSMASHCTQTLDADADHFLWLDNLDQVAEILHTV